MRMTLLYMQWSFLEQLPGLRSVDRTGEEISLTEFAAECSQRFELPFGLDTFGDDVDTKVLTEHQDRFDDRSAFFRRRSFYR